MITINKIFKRFGSRIVLNNISYRFPEKGSICLSGINGAGKTTLLNILTNLEESDDGSIIKPKNSIIGYLPQEPNPDPASSILQEAINGADHILNLQNRLNEVLNLMGNANLSAKESLKLHNEYDAIMHNLELLDGFALESSAKELLIGLGFKHSQLDDSPKTLSGGWRMRLELVRLFLKKPNLLILDEPTNHLDLPSMKWVENFLKSFDGCLLFVSHDRELINRLADGILYLNNGDIKYYKGNYDDFLESYEQEQEQILAQKTNLESKTKHIEKFVDRFGAKASKAKQVQSRIKMLEKLYSKSDGLTIDKKTQPISLKLECLKKSGKIALEVKNLTTGYDINKPLVSNLNFKLERSQKLAIVGANGIGKSTLLKTIVNIIKPLNGEIMPGHDVDIAYFAQDQLNYLNENETVLQNLMHLNPYLSMSQARSMLGAFLFKGDDVFKNLKILSGGEKNRVGLCCLLAKKANTLILDEPTNHLDMQSVDILADALNRFEGTLILVSHNRSIINDVATHVMGMNAKGQTLLVEGDFERFEQKCQELEFEF